MATFSDKMTAINNEIRTMTNTTAPLGLDAMKEHLADANEEISEQDALVEQLISAMAGKSVPGSGGEWIPIASLPTVFYGEPVLGDSGKTTYYIEIPNDTAAVIFRMMNFNILETSSVTFYYNGSNSLNNYSEVFFNVPRRSAEYLSLSYDNTSLELQQVLQVSVTTDAIKMFDYMYVYTS